MNPLKLSAKLLIITILSFIIYLPSVLLETSIAECCWTHVPEIRILAYAYTNCPNATGKCLIGKRMMSTYALADTFNCDDSVYPCRSTDSMDYVILSWNGAGSGYEVTVDWEVWRTRNCNVTFCFYPCNDEAWDHYGFETCPDA